MEFVENKARVNSKVNYGRENSLHYSLVIQTTEIEKEKTPLIWNHCFWICLSWNAHCIFFSFCIVFENNKNSVIWVWVLFVCIMCQGKRWVHYYNFSPDTWKFRYGKKPVSSSLELVYQNWTSYMFILSDYLVYVCRDAA